MNESENQHYTFNDFLDAWRAARRWVGAHPDLADYHGDRYRAFASVFGADLNEAPDPGPPVPDWLASEPNVWRFYIHPFVLSAEDQARKYSSPWSGYLEAPTAIHRIHRRYSAKIQAALESAQSETRQMCNDLLAALYPEAAANTITADQLRMAGFDPDRREPCEYDYW